MKSINKQLITVLTLSMVLAVPNFARANFGGQDVDDIPSQGDKTYIGKYQPSDGAATGGDVTIDEQQLVMRVIGGYSGNGVATNNTVSIKDNTTVMFVYGGYSNNGDVFNNVVNIDGGVVRDVYGGSSISGEVSNNTVNISGGKTEGWVYGGYSNGVGVVANNTVNMIDGDAAIITGGRSDAWGAVSKNTVNISGGETYMAYGGYSDGTGLISNNVVNISGGIVYNAYGGSTSYQSTISDNTVNVISGEVYRVYGGYSGGTALISNNIVNIIGGTIKGNVYGGYSYAGTADQISYNTVNISGAPMFDPSTQLWGGYIDTNVDADVRSNNTLRIMTTGISVAKVANFQHYDLAIGAQTTLTVGESLTLKTGDTITSTRVLSSLDVGDTVSLLKSTNGLNIAAATLVDGMAKQGVLFEYGYRLKKDDTGLALMAEIISKNANKQSMSVADGQLAAMGILRSGADLIATVSKDKSKSGYDVFGAMNYTNMSMNSISNIDVHGSSMIVGASRTLQHKSSELTIGAFLESGWGTYDSALDTAKAKGHTNYYGLGVLARNDTNSGLYTEGSVRVGKVGNTYSGYKVEDETYDVHSTYYGAHLGIGKIKPINATTSTDIYAKYFYVHKGAADTNIAGDRFVFDAISSSRVRLGGRLNNVNKNITRYVGLAYEYEFSGKATATAYSESIASPTVKGSTGILEIGAKYQPDMASKFSMDFGLNAYIGKRQGFSGNMKLNWGF